MTKAVVFIQLTLYHSQSVFLSWLLHSCNFADTIDGRRTVSRGAMGLFPATRHSVKACLNSSLLRPPNVSPAKTRLPLHLVRVSFQPSIPSFHRTFTLSSRLCQQPIRPTDHDRQTEEKTRGAVNEKFRAVGAEKIWTIPNILTFSRILSCPALGYAILHNNFYVATGLLVYASLTDLVRARFP